MEIEAKIYAISRDENLLRKAYQILKEKIFGDYMSVEKMEPCAVLPITQAWYGFTESAEMADEPEEWMDSLQECAGILRKDGAVVVEFRSPADDPDYLEYAYTTSSGNAGSGGRLDPCMHGYTRATGNNDIESAMYELFSGRGAWERERASRRINRKEAIRREKGDFEITPDGVLKKYRGHDSDVVIPDGVKEIGESAFVDLKGVERMLVDFEEYDAPEMETLTIPDSVVRIQSYAFAYCLNLTTVDIPDSVLSIGERAFEGCESLKKIHLPAGLTEIEEFTFFLCEELKSITIPEKVLHIRKNAFDSCSLSSIKLPDGLLSIGEEAFQGCNIRKVRIPESVTEIASNAFPGGTDVTC